MRYFILFILLIISQLTSQAQERRQYPPLGETIPPQTFNAAQTSTQIPTAPDILDSFPQPEVSTVATRVSPNEVRLSGCLMEVLKEVWLSANMQGLIRSLHTELRDTNGQILRDESGKPRQVEVKEGLQIWENQILGWQDDRLAQADLKIAETEYAVALEEARKLIEVEHARTAWLVEDAKVQMIEETNARVAGAVSQTEVLEAKMKRKQAEAQFELSQYTLGIRDKEAQAKLARLDAAKVQVELRQLVAPWNGEVVEVKSKPGEWLREGDRVLKVIQLDHLRVRGKVNAREYTPEMFRGRDAVIVAKMFDGTTEQFPAKVVFANYIVQSGDTFEIHIEVANRLQNGWWMLQPGKLVDAVVHINPVQ